MKIYEFADKWLISRADYLRESTYINYAYAITRFKRFFPDAELTQLTPSDVASAFSIMAEQALSRSSIYNVRQVMRAVYNQAVEDDLIAKNPFRKAKIPVTAPQKRVVAYTPEEEKVIIQQASNDILGDPYIFLLLTGLRVSELINLEWSDYDPQTHCISIRKSKTKSGVATIAISHTAEALIGRQKKMPTHNRIFSNTKGNPLSISSMRKLLKRLKSVTHIDDVTNHKCRHTFCTRMIELGVDPKTVSSLARHSSVAFTMQQYVTSSIQMQRDGLELLDNAVLF